MTAFYNDTEPYVAEWSRNLISAGVVPFGDMCETPIQDIEAWELTEYEQCHFFSGILGWPLALQMAGWPAGIKTWTGSCPCQPFSVAGKRKGINDERHLWPYFRNLIEQCRPSIVFGEQVASKDGRIWLAGVRADLEALGYVVGAADLCAAGVGAPHIRQRLYWMAYAEHAERRAEREKDSDTYGRNGSRRSSDLSGLEHSRGEQEGFSRQSRESRGTDAGRMGDDDDARLEGRRLQRSERADQFTAWTPSAFIQCLDGKTRRIEPGVFPLAHGVSARVGKLRAYGNAIVSPLAAEFIKGAMDVLGIY